MPAEINELVYEKGQKKSKAGGDEFLPHVFQTLHKFVLMAMRSKSWVLGCQRIETVHVD